MRYSSLLDRAEQDAEFVSELTRPVTPRFAQTSVATSPHRVTSTQDISDLALVVDASLQDALVAAEVRAERTRSSTTLSALAVAKELVGDAAGAADAARDTLSLCIVPKGDPAPDPFAARLAVDVLLRQGDVASVEAYAAATDIPDALRLPIAVSLAARGRLDDASQMLDGAGGTGQSAARGYVALSRGDFARAVGEFRKALRENPRDAESSINLAIALWQLGSTQKAIAAASRARNAAPDRLDFVAQYCEMLLLAREFKSTQDEIAKVRRRGFDLPSRLLTMQGRAELGMGDTSSAIKTLRRSLSQADLEGDFDARIEIESNLLRLDRPGNEVDKDAVVNDLYNLHLEHPGAEVIVVNLVRAANRRHHLATARDAYARLLEKSVEGVSRATYIEYEIASLAGDVSEAAARAMAWFAEEPANTEASASVLVETGIGQARWLEVIDEARRIADLANPNLTALNNAAYVLAMGGEGEKALALISKWADGSVVYKATLGLAHLSVGNIEKGMRLYREAADASEKDGDGIRSLMTQYQALVVHQLGLKQTYGEEMISALALPFVPLPDSWEDQPEFLRLESLSKLLGLSWPMSV